MSTNNILKWNDDDNTLTAYLNNDSGDTEIGPAKWDDDNNKLEINYSGTDYQAMWDDDANKLEVHIPILTAIWSKTAYYCNDIELDAFDGSGNCYYGKGTSNYSIGKLDSDGEDVWEYNSAECSGVAVDSSGNVYGCVASGYVPTNLIKINSSGTEQWTKPGEGLDRDIEIDSSDYLYISGNRDIYGRGYTLYKCDSDGNRIWRKNLGENVAGRKIAIDGSNNIYLATSKQTGYDTIYKFTSGGTLIWSKDTGSSAYGVAVDDSGNVYVVGDRLDLGGGQYATLWKYNSSGTLLMTADSLKSARDVAVGNDGKIYIAQYGYNEDTDLTILNSSGEIIDTYGAFSSHATCIEVDTKGDIYIGGYTIGSGGSVRKIGYR